MRKIVILTACLVAFVANSFGQNVIKKGEQGVSSVGVILGHAVTSKSLTVGADYRYNILDRVRLAPSFMYVLKNEGMNSMYLNADAHYLARITKEITIYPIGGLGILSRKFDHFFDPNDYGYGEEGYGEDDYGYYQRLIKPKTKTYVGLNLGFGGEMRVTKDIIVGAEFRYNLTAERFYDQAMLLARVAYYF